MYNCSLVIRAFNEAAYIGRLLEGLSRQTMRDVEIILVDSGSTDGTAGIAAAAGAKVVHIPPAEFTFGRSLNLGLAAAACDLVAVASAHVYPVYPDWLERLLEPFTDLQVVLTYGKQRTPASAYFSEQQIYRRWYPERSELHQSHPFCNNANAALRLSAWKAHPYDETLTGLEDLAWAKWALGEDYRIAYVAEAEIIHVHNETWRGIYNRYWREAMAFKHIYPEAHFSLYDLSRNIVASINFDLLHAARAYVLLGSLPSIIRFRWLQFWGTYQGYRQSSLVTPELRQTFYYHVGWKKTGSKQRDVEPIQYEE
jgi:rhamnosyltransferase